MSFIVSKLTGDTMVFYPVDPETGDIKDELWHLRHGLAKHRAVWGGVCAECQRTYPCAAGKALRDAVNAEQSRRRETLFGAPVRRPYKRSDIPTAVVLATVNTFGMRAFEALCETFPWKVVHAAFLRELRRGLIECGTSEVRTWLTPEGKDWIRRERMKCIA